MYSDTYLNEVKKDVERMVEGIAERCLKLGPMKNPPA